MAEVAAKRKRAPAPILDVSPLARAEAEFFALLRPPPRLSLPDWIEQEIYLPSSLSALPGRVRLHAHQVGIAEAISDPAIERVTVQKAARVGYSLLLGGVIGSFVVNEPSPVLAILPTEADCRNFMVDQLEPTFEASPVLRGKLSGDSDESGRNTLLNRIFAGGWLKVVASKAPRNLRAHTARVVIFDEIDAMVVSDEGDPIALGIKRTDTFANRKIILGGTPVYTETSHVIRSYGESDARVFEVPCPECGAFTEIMWGHIEWPEGEPEKAAFRCPHCQALVDERHKPEMARAGHWRITRPDIKGHAGFRLNALISTVPAASWPRLAAEFLKAKRTPETLQPFVNTVLGQGWDSRGAEALNESELQARAEPIGLQAMPADVRVITCGVDIQRSWGELVFLGFAESTTYILGHSVVHGDPKGDEFWLEIEDAIRTRWRHPLGNTIGVDACAIDSGDGETTDYVYGFTQPRFARRVVAIKGVPGHSRQAIERSASKGKILFLVGVDGLKRRLATSLAHGQSWRFSNTLSTDFFEQLCSEVLVTRYVRGQPTRLWERIPGRRAECLDATIYALAAKGLVNLDFTRRENELRGLASAPMPTVFKSKWMQGGRP
jgi:phage terminase large subunit GpA-like protein